MTLGKPQTSLHRASTGSKIKGHSLFSFIERFFVTIVQIFMTKHSQKRLCQNLSKYIYPKGMTSMWLETR